MIRRQPRSTSTDPTCPYTACFRSRRTALERGADDGAGDDALARGAGGLLGLDGEALGAEGLRGDGLEAGRSEEHTSELQSLMRISYAVFCLKKKKTHTNIQ